MWWGRFHPDGRSYQENPIAVERLADAELVLRVQATRIDWVLQKAGLHAPPVSLPIIGSFRAATEVFRGFVERWLGMCPPVHRLAFGGLVYLPVSSRAEGYNILSELLPFRLDADEASDFMYQINRPRQVKSDGCEYKLNRLAKWSVARFEVMEVEIPSGGVSARERTREIGNACQVELDVNTAPGEQPETLRGDELMGIFRHLIHAGEEILTHGDIP
jgi:hypothetical protein